MNGPPIFDPETGEILSEEKPSEAGGEMPPVPVMSLDDARAALVREHGVAIGKDDPLLMLITLHQGMVRDYEAMLRRHDDGIKRLLGATGDACAEAVETLLDSIKDKTVKASLDQAFALVERQAVAMEELRRTLRRHRVFHTILTVLAMGSCLLAIAVLRSAIR